MNNSFHLYFFSLYINFDLDSTLKVLSIRISDGQVNTFNQAKTFKMRVIPHEALLFFRNLMHTQMHIYLTFIFRIVCF